MKDKLMGVLFWELVVGNVVLYCSLFGVGFIFPSYSFAIYTMFPWIVLLIMHVVDKKSYTETVKRLKDDGIYESFMDKYDLR